MGNSPELAAIMKKVGTIEDPMWAQDILINLVLLMTYALNKLFGKPEIDLNLLSPKFISKLSKQLYN